MRLRLAAVTIAALAAAPLAASAGAAQASTSTYHYANVRYGFSLSVPSFLRESNPPVDGDGRDFTAPDYRTSHADLVAYGANNVNDLTASTYQKDELRHLPRGFHVTYKSRVGNVVALSGVQPGPKGGTVSYERTVVGTGSVDTLAFSYPASQTAFYDPLVTLVVRSYRPGNVNDSH